MWEIEISHMGKNSGNPVLVCEKTVSIGCLFKNIEKTLTGWY